MHSWILDVRSQALQHLGRFEEGLSVLQRAAQLPDRQDRVSQPINLAFLLCALGRPDEALAALPGEEGLSKYGRMQVELVRLEAAVETGREEGARQALDYLREHRTDALNTLQRALIVAGEPDEAERLLLTRLEEPNTRTSALTEVQLWSYPPLPPRAESWRAARQSVEQRPAVLAAVKRLGEIGRYPWHYSRYD